MDRRSTIKTLLLGGTSAGVLLHTGMACTAPTDKAPELGEASDTGYGIRTPEEERQDRLVRSETFFTTGELAALLVLADAICPEDETGPAASATGIDEFFEFNVKDLPETQLPMRGGLAFVQNLSRSRYAGKTLTELTPAELDGLMQDLSWRQPDEEDEDPELAPAISFMSALRYMTLTGYYSSDMGVKALGYAGNIPNQWDGVPPEVLAKYEVDYEPEWIAKCIDHDTAYEIAQWDEEGNLIS